ncbi:MAG: putative glycosyl transferase [Pedosphaera sp.]|nr:putative glycosyl transferase [Pedosphaera sp.]
MKFLLLNQTFHPDVASTAQHLSELALRLAERGHEVTVVTSRRAYDDPERRFPKEETWRGIRIIRVGSTGFGKGAKWKRAADFASFILRCFLRVVFLPRQDAVVALTSPPLISFLGAWLAKVRGSRFFYWVMDFNPDEAIAAGWLRPGSLVTRGLDGMSRFSLRQATRIIALDRFMRDRIVAKGILPERVVVLPPWSHDGEVKYDLVGRERFRKAHGLDGKFVVMYSGNHSPCHPLDSLMAVAERWKEGEGVVFCFVGGGSEFKRVKKWAEQGGHKHVVCLPYQPLDQLSGSLSAAELQVVVMGDPFVGLVHPCKIYNILSIGAPVLYVGPNPSHLSEILAALDGEYVSRSAAHGKVEKIAAAIREVRQQSGNLNREVPTQVRSLFSKEAILPKLVRVLESDGSQPLVPKEVP